MDIENIYMAHSKLMGYQNNNKTEACITNAKSLN